MTVERSDRVAGAGRSGVAGAVVVGADADLDSRAADLTPSRGLVSAGDAHAAGVADPAGVDGHGGDTTPPEALILWFVAWDGCDCTDVQPNRGDLPVTCPCHGGHQLGISAITEGVSTNLGHLCALPTETTATTPKETR